MEPRRRGPRASCASVIRRIATALAALGAGLLLGGCEPESLQAAGGRPNGFVLDAGLPVPVDAGAPPDAEAPADATAAPDAAPPDTGPLDAGAPDAGEGPRCACPEVPRTCSPPTLEAPITTLDRDAQVELLNLLSCAETSVRAALYDMEWRCIEDALFDRLGRVPDLRVELVIDDDQCPRDAEGKLTCALRDLEGDARVTVVDDARSRYMHHKFWIVDERWVWTGSANMTEDSFCTDYNDAIVLADPTIVAAYAARFEALFVDGDFGPQPRAAPLVAGPYRLHFGPQSPLSTAPSWHERLLEAIAGARARVDFGIFALTREDVADALIAAHQRGVQVKGVVHSRYATRAAAARLIEAGVPVRKASMHSKLLVVDTATVATGTPNWSSNAWENNEDSLWIHDPSLAARYQAELERAWQAAGSP